MSSKVKMLLVIVVYFSASVLGKIIWQTLELDSERIPNVAYLAVGPLISLAVGHGLIFYFVATLICIPMALIACRAHSRERAFALILSSVAVWILVGSMMI